MCAEEKGGHECFDDTSLRVIQTETIENMFMSSVTAVLITYSIHTFPPTVPGVPHSQRRGERHPVRALQARPGPGAAGGGRWRGAHLSAHGAGRRAGGAELQRRQHGGRALPSHQAGGTGPVLGVWLGIYPGYVCLVGGGGDVVVIVVVCQNGEQSQCWASGWGFTRGTCALLVVAVLLSLMLLLLFVRTGNKVSAWCLAGDLPGVRVSCWCWR